MTLITATSTHANAPKPLPRCPNSPNCVSSQADANDETHFVAPFKIIVEPAQAWASLQTMLTNLKRVNIKELSDNSLHAEATSLFFRFIDDIDVVLDQDTRIIDIRSASRTGYSDFGVNRKRVEKLRKSLQQAHIIE